MKTKKIILLIISLLGVTGCTSNTANTSTKIDEYVECGIKSKFIANISYEPAKLRTAIKALKQQEASNVKLQGFAGCYYQGFYNRWIKRYPQYPNFAVLREIFDQYYNSISITFLHLLDLENESDYLIYKHCDENFEVYEFTHTFEDNVDFEEIGVKKGMVRYRIDLVDANNQINYYVFDYGPTYDGELNFINEDSKVTFYDHAHYKEWYNYEI